MQTRLVTIMVPVRPENCSQKLRYVSESDWRFSNWGQIKLSVIAFQGQTLLPQIDETQHVNMQTWVMHNNTSFGQKFKWCMYNYII